MKRLFLLLVLAVITIFASAPAGALSPPAACELTTMLGHPTYFAIEYQAMVVAVVKLDDVVESTEARALEPERLTPASQIFDPSIASVPGDKRIGFSAVADHRVRPAPILASDLPPTRAVSS